MAEARTGGEAPRRYDLLVLSPHPDDAVLSCGGRIAAAVGRGQSVLVATVMTAEPDPAVLSPFARELHRGWRLDEPVMAARRREDEAACARLGAGLTALGFLDAVYRFDPASGAPRYPSLAALRGRSHALDRELVEPLAGAFRDLPRADAVAAPLGAGGHVDHRLVRSVASAVFGRGLELYEDFPYARHRLAVLKALGWERPRYRSVVHPIEGPAVEAKQAAAACYASQLRGLFATEDELGAALAERARVVGGERSWLFRR